MLANQQNSDAFPSTRHTWIGKHMREGDSGRQEVLTHLMEVYAQPLAIYCRGCSLRWLGDADDLVRGFFADRLTREAFLDRWLESNRPLRAWLIVGFKHFLYEQARRQRRDQAESIASELDHQGTQADQAFDREYARRLVASALCATQEACNGDGLDEHWDVFKAHHVDGLDYESIHQRFGVDPKRSAVMSRTMRERFKAALREAVAWEGARDDEIDGEIQSLMEALRS